MAAPRWDNEQLDRLAEQVKDIAGITESNSRAIENNNRLIESNARVIQALANVAAEAREERLQLLQLIERHQQRMVEIEERIDRQQTNIDGLRRETMRMLDILLNQRDRQDNSEE